jgi:hypothetical protein
VRRRFQTRSDNAPNHHPKTSLVECVQQALYAPSTYAAGAPAGVHGSLPGSRLVTRLRDFGSRPRLLTRLRRQPRCFAELLPYAYPATSIGLQMQDPSIYAADNQPNHLDRAQELTRLTHPAPDSMSPVSLFLGLPVGGSQAAATRSARGPVGPTLWEQAPRQVSNCSRLLRKPPKAYNLALAAHIHRGDFAAPEIPQATHMGKVLP